jgi:antirestriction protein ArdC
VPTSIPASPTAIIADLENGVRPWLKPWSADNMAGRITRPLRNNGQPYKGINVLMLWGETIAKGHISPIWMTYRQAAGHGGQVHKGEHGSLVVYADHIRKTDTDDNGDEIERKMPFLKSYTVFNAAQIDGLPAHFYAAPSPPLLAPLRIASAERFARDTGIAIRHGGNRAFYAVDADHVQLPPFESFTDAESYYATLLHELVTRHPSRSAREFGRKRGACPGPRAGGDEGYAAEELVAELDGADGDTIVQDDFSLLEARNPLRHENCQSSVVGILGTGGRFDSFPADNESMKSWIHCPRNTLRYWKRAEWCC